VPCGFVIIRVARVVFAVLLMNRFFKACLFLLFDFSWGRRRRLWLVVVSVFHRPVVALVDTGIALHIHTRRPVPARHAAGEHGKLGRRTPIGKAFAPHQIRPNQNAAPQLRPHDSEVVRAPP
jgi:hypothetical protein